MIIDTSVEIIKNEGIEAFSARRLAAELNISSMTVYNYYRNIDEIKKEVIIKGFSILYKMIFQEILEKKNNLSKDVIICLSKIMAVNMMNFALENKEIFILMFTEYGYKFRKDSELRHYYDFLPQLTSQVKLNKNEFRDFKKALFIIETVIKGLIMEKLRQQDGYSLEEYNEHIDFTLNHLLKKNEEDR